MKLCLAALALALSALACGSSAQTSGSPLALTGIGASGFSRPLVPAKLPIRAVDLTYDMAHRGDHVPWVGAVRVSIGRETRARQPVWRKTHAVEGGSRAGAIGGTAILTAGLDVVEISETLGTDVIRSVWQEDRLALETKRNGKRHEPVKLLPLPGPLSVDYAALDVVLPSLPLARGYATKLWVLDFDYVKSRSWRFRPFSLAVVGRESIAVPAGEFDAFRVAMTPLDDSPRLATTFHVRASSPRFIVRKEYVVNPVTVGAIKRSSGTEELRSVEWR